MFKKITLVLSLLCVGSSFSQHTISKIDSIVKATAVLNPELGISVGIIDHNETHFFNYGHLNRTENIKIDKNSLFEIGSITKLFTTYLIAQQVTLGNISWDAVIDEYLPTSITLHKDIQNKIKVSDLASHQSGLPDIDFKKLMEINPKQPLDEVTTEMVDSILVNTSKLPTYGSYQYSNISYVLLGYILEQVTQTNYETNITNNILTPYKMSTTKTTDYTVKNRTIGYNAQGEAQAFFNWNSVIAPAGLIKSNSADMLKFTQLFLTPNNQAITTQLEETYFKNTFIELGLGLNVMREDGHVVFAKTGDTLGQSSVIAYNPDKNWGIVILTNQANSTARHLFNQIFEILK